VRAAAAVAVEEEGIPSFYVAFFLGGRTMISLFLII
jgi:hypothetical protein